MTSAINQEAISQLSNYFNSILPKSNYGKKASETTFYLIFHNNLNPLTMKWLGDPAVLTKRLLTPLSPIGITPLHLSVLLNRQAITEALLGYNLINLNAQDRSGWTPLHCAYLINDLATAQLLIKKGADESKRNILGGTPKKIWELIYTTPDPLRQKFYYKNDAGAIVEGNGNKFCELTGANRFVDKENIVEVAFMIDQWLEGKYCTAACEQKIDEKIWNRVVAEDPPVYLEKSPTLGWEVKARELIKKGTALLPYLGRSKIQSDAWTNLLEKTEPEPGQYVFHNVDAAEDRSLAAITNDNLPNLQPVSFFRINGQESLQCFETLLDIAPGTPLCWSYGPKARIKYSERQNESLETLITTYTRIKKGSTLYDAYHSPNADELIDNYVDYALTTPTILLTLTAKGILTLPEIQEFLKSEKTTRLIFTRSDRITFRMITEDLITKVSIPLSLATYIRGQDAAFENKLDKKLSQMLNLDFSGWITSFHNFVFEESLKS